TGDVPRFRNSSSPCHSRRQDAAAMAICLAARAARGASGAGGAGGASSASGGRSFNGGGGGGCDASPRSNAAPSEPLFGGFLHVRLSLPAFLGPRARILARMAASVGPRRLAARPAALRRRVERLSSGHAGHTRRPLQSQRDRI